MEINIIKTLKSTLGRNPNPRPNQTVLSPPQQNDTITLNSSSKSPEYSSTPLTQNKKSTLWSKIRNTKIHLSSEPKTTRPPRRIPHGDTDLLFVTNNRTLDYNTLIRRGADPNSLIMKLKKEHTDLSYPDLLAKYESVKD